MLHGYHKIILFFIAALVLIPGSVQAGEVSLGLGYPYAGIKYTIYKNLDFEVRYATGEGINVYAGRFYWNFHNSERLKGFTGIDGGGIKFNTLDTKGSGYEGSVFIGGEYFIFEKLSLALDFAPTYIGLKEDSATGDSTVNNIEWVGNIALYFYFKR